VPDKDAKLAKDLLNYFVRVAFDRHFSACATPGMHMLLHVVDDLVHLGCHMDYLGAWPFENSMKVLLHSKRSNHRAIQQMLNRETERLNCQLPTDASGRILSLTPLAQYIGVDVEETTPRLITNTRHKKTLVFPNEMGGFRLKSNVRDAFCVMATGVRADDFVIVQCTDFELDPDTHDGGIIIIGHVYKYWSDVFDKPKPSHKYHVYKFTGKVADETKKFRAEKVLTKLYVFPDLHVFESDAELDSIYKYKATPYPKADVWAVKNLADFPSWYGVGIRHIPEKGASLY
jgi:hypothetical protein